jgi:ATP-binding cassette subfamily B multidrug efflux pump
MVVFSSYSMQVIMSFLLMSMVFVLWPRADVSAQRVLEVLDTEPIVKTARRSALTVQEAKQRGIITPAERARYADDLELAGEIEFRNVSFTYPDSREAMLEGINFTANRVRRWRSSAPPAPASRRSSISCRASTTPRKARCSSTA